MLQAITASWTFAGTNSSPSPRPQAIGSSHCRLAHGVKSLKAFPEDQLAAIARDFRTAGLEPAEVAMMEYAQKLSRDASRMTDEDTLRVLRGHGFTDRDIMDITLAAAARNYLSRTLLALAVDLDVPPSLSPGLREALFTRSPRTRPCCSFHPEAHGLWPGRTLLLGEPV